MEFNQFKQIFQHNFTQFAKNQKHLYQTATDKDVLWDTYLNSFPENIRQEYNCNCCKRFIKNYGSLVSIDSAYKLTTFWDFEVNNTVWQTVVNNLRNAVLSRPIIKVFVSETRSLGTDSNLDVSVAGQAIRWEHLYYQLPNTILGIVSKRGDNSFMQAIFRDNKEIFQRGLTTLRQSATLTALELIENNLLYRGEGFKPLLQEFLCKQREYSNVPLELRANYLWQETTNSNNALLRIRNTAIGTLLIDLSEETDLDTAVRKYESVVAPTNYKRPQAIVTASMLQDAQKTIASLGLTDALNRRFAVPDDIDINDVLWTNRNKVTTNVFERLQQDLLIDKDKLRANRVGIEEFISDILPTANRTELLFENRLAGNLISLLTSENKNSPSLFKWNNSFSWCYRRGLTDSMREKVKNAGGTVDGKLRISLAWHNFDDLDLHVYEPKAHIYFGSKKSPYTRGTLDVDMNVSPTTREPVENIIYPYDSNLPDGEYTIRVNNYTPREHTNTGYSVEIELEGQIFEFSSANSPAYHKPETVAILVVKNNQITVKTAMKAKLVSKSIWGLETNKFLDVEYVMLSPNYWRNYATGNKHFIFTVDNVHNDEPVKGLFNEFLKEELSKHRKVFEVLSNKIVVPSSNKQVGGLGFSSTIANELTVRINNNQVYTVVVGAK